MHGYLSIGATYTIAEYILPQVVGFFKTARPEVQISICVGNREELPRAERTVMNENLSSEGVRQVSSGHWLRPYTCVELSCPRARPQLGPSGLKQVDRARLVLGQLRSSELSANVASRNLPRPKKQANAEHYLHEVCHKLLESKCDIILVAGDHQNKKIICEKWLTDNLALIVHSDHPWAERGSIYPAELYEERFILREVGSSSRQLWENV